MTLADVLARLENPQPSGGGWLARCPAHRDGSPSLMVSEGHTVAVVMHCFAGCRRSDILVALGLDDQRPGPTLPAISSLSEEELGRRDAIRDALHAQARRHKAGVPMLYYLADHHRKLLLRIRALHATAQGMPPELESTWELLAEAGRLEDEWRLVNRVLERW